MDRPLSSEKLNEERAFIKRYTEGLGSHKVEYPADFSTPLEDRPRKVVPVQIPVAEPPESMDVDDAGIQDTTLTLTIKSLKPSLSLSVTTSLTDSVSDLKLVIAKSSPAAPPADSQRLLLKGKALTDSKLLKEYDLTDGATVHLMMKAPVAAPASASASTSVPSIVTTPAGAGAGTAVGTGQPPSSPSPIPKGSPSSPAPPSLTITSSNDDLSSPGVSMPLTNIDIAAPPLGPQPEVTSATFHNTLSDPLFWQKIHALCVNEFAYENEADECWEHFLRAMKGKLSAGEAAKIRDVVGVRGMGGA